MDSLEIQRAGPIHEGQIDPKPLTIFAGSNGSGKSYAAMILHSFKKDLEGPAPFGNLFSNWYIDDRIPEAEFGDIGPLVEEFQEEKEVAIPSELYNSVLESFYQIIFETKFEGDLEKIFSTEINNLIKAGHRSIRFDIHSDLGYSRLNKFSSWDSLEAEIIPTVDQDPIMVDLARMEDELDDNRNDLLIPVDTEQITRGIGENIIINGIVEFIQSQLDLNLNSDSHFLPASRAGLLQSHKILTMSAFDRLSQVGFEPIEVPAFSGVVSNYLQQIVDLSNEDEGELSDLAESFQSHVLNGSIKVERQEEKPHPEIKFASHGQEFPLHLASTSVSELAPLILYTKYVLSEGSTVIIEEPEAHLHPENQRKVAYFIVKLVNRGVNVIVTTHSDFLLEQINNSIRLSQVENIPEESGLEDLPSIRPEDVSAHFFVYHEDEGEPGYIIERLEVDDVDGIPMDEFERVSNELYGESYKVDNLLFEQKGGL